MKVLVTEQIAQEAIEIVRTIAHVDNVMSLEPQALESIIEQYDAVIVRSQTKITSAVIDSAKRLRVIGRAGVGVDNIDVDAATRRGIIVVNSSEGNIVSTAEHSIAMLLSLVRRIPEANNSLKAGVWNRKIKAHEIRNKTLGIIGLGKVGTEVAHLAKGLRMNVIAHDPMVSEDRAEKVGVRLVEAETLLATSDFVTIHVPLNSATQGLVGYEQLRLMKPTAMIVNCARGGIIDEVALYHALNDGIVAGAAVDVYSKEPGQDNILLKSDKVVATPHLAASTYEAERSTSKDIAEQIVSVLKGNPPRFPVNAPLISGESMAVIGPYLPVGTTIGRIALQLATGQIESLAIRCEGDIAKENTTLIKVAVLSGLLETLAEERITIVNADAIARDRGLIITEQKNDLCDNYANMITVEVRTTSGRTLVAGSLLRGRTYLTRVDDHWMEIEPFADYMLFTEHKDRPGMVGAVGSILGDADVNISQMHVGLGINGSVEAMMALCLDKPIPTEYYQQILSIPDMYRVLLVKLAA